MRETTFKILTGDCVAIYPDEVCFAFNPNFIEVESAWTTATLTVTVSEKRNERLLNSQSIKASMRGGKVTIYLSRLFELMFEDPRTCRSIMAHVDVSIGNSLQLFNFDTLVVWGNLAVGERFGAYGVFNRDTNKKQFERSLVWFKNFPFNVSVFRYASDVSVYGRYDGRLYGNTPLNLNLGNVAYFHKLDRVTNTLPSLSDVVLSSPTEIIYFERLKRFVAKNGTTYYRNWAVNDAEKIGATSAYCDVNNSLKPLGTKNYIFNADAGEQRYKFISDELQLIGPFSVVGFLDLDVRSLFPSAQNNATLKYKISDEDRLTSVFDTTFDYTFFQTGENTAIIKLAISDETAGFYLRWIDRQGNLQYYLFTKGQTTHKNKPGSDVVTEYSRVNGLYFANHARTRSFAATVTHKCCAVHLPQEVFDYVVTIITAPVVDLYCGKDANGVEIWQPVNIQSNSVNYNPQERLHDLEMSFNTPDINAQTL